VFRNVLNRAVRWNLIVRNLVVLTDPRRREHRCVVPLAQGEGRISLEAAKGHRLEALFTAALFLRLRQGEILGLVWADVDLDAGTLRVTQALQRVDGKLIFKAPKTEKSRRRLTLPATLVAALRAHRDRQAFERQALQRVNGKPPFVEPKSESSRRTITLPAVAMAAFRAQRTRQLEQRLLAGD